MLQRALRSALVSIAVSSVAYTDPSRNLYNQGVQAELQRNLDTAYELLKKAYTISPKNARYLAAYTRIRFSAALDHVHKGETLRSAGSLTQAMAEFERAVAMDSSNYLAQQELRQTADALRRQERAKTAPPEKSKPDNPAEDLSQPVELQQLSNAPITMYMTANADVAYKTVGKLAGFNVIVDPEYKPQKITVDLNNVSLRDALDLIRLQSKTIWRPVLSNVIFVSSDTAAKRKEVEQNVMKTFYLRNIETPNELQEAANVVKQLLDVTRIQLVQSQDALIVRGSPDQLLLAEKLLADFDKPRSEVLIDIAVMQVSRDRIQNLGTAVPTSFSASLVPNGGGLVSSSSNSSNNNGSGSNSGSATGSFTIKSLGHIGSGNVVLGIPGASFTALSSDSNTKLLQNPEIRALNNEKATLRIGDRVPIATGSFQPGLTGGSVSPLVSTQFQYLDVGVNIDITPHIHSDREVTLKMSLEISSVTGQQNIGGITQPVIGQRRIEHETRLTDGEINLLGGILEDTETQSLSGYPWISKIPILKYLFGQNDKERTENEIVFAITPHIVRAQEVSDPTLRAIDVGTASSIELRRKPIAPPTAAEHPAETKKPGEASAIPLKTPPGL